MMVVNSAQPPLKADHVLALLDQLLQKSNEKLEFLEWAANEVNGTVYERFFIDCFTEENRVKNKIQDKLNQVRLA